jgi:hypothetical protein
MATRKSSSTTSSSTTSSSTTSTTAPTGADVDAFVDGVQHEVRRCDARTLVDLMQGVTGEPPRMWGSSIVGFGSYHYVYASGREGDMAAVGFSPRAASTTVYLMDGFEEYAEDLARLGPHSLGRSCLYLKDLAKLDLAVLENLVRRSYQATTSRTWPPTTG